MQIIVAISDARASADRNDELVTYSLGSCIGVTLFDPVAGVGGLLHFQLPSGAADTQRSAERPLMFADTGVKSLLAKMEGMGGQRKRMRVHIAGAAQMLNDAQIFEIGKRNHAAIRKVFWQLGMFIEAEHVGGPFPRTMFLRLADGQASIKWNNELVVLATRSKCHA